MTEADWMICADPTRMLAFARGKISDRLARLFEAACCRCIWHLLVDERSRKAVEAAERYADGELSEEELASARIIASAAVLDAGRAEMDAEVDANFHYTAPYQATWVEFAAACAARATVSATVGVRVGADGRDSGEPEIPVIDIGARLCHEWVGSAFQESSRLRLDRGSEFADARWGDYLSRPGALGPADLLRELIGPLPFREVTILPVALAWGDGTVVNLARTIYQERAFDDGMPILADALEDAGCANEEVLSHLRCGEPHFRGCWALDLILGKE